MKLENLQEARYTGKQYTFDEAVSPLMQWLQQQMKEDNADPQDGDWLGSMIDQVGQHIWDNLGK